MANDLRHIDRNPYWLDQLGAAPPSSGEPPAKADVLVVGAGYTGLNAAIETARGGLSTLVLDAEEPGFGCSARNGGHVSTSVKPSLEKLTAKFGERKARAIRNEGKHALDWIAEFVASEGLDCDFRRSGRFHGAHTPRSYESLARDSDRAKAQEGVESYAVPRSEQRAELGTDAYFGGVVYPGYCSLQPAKYLRELLRLASGSGAQVLGRCPALAIERTSGGFGIRTPKGEVEAREVVVATNGYTGAESPWLRRRVIPIDSYLVATEKLPRSLIDALFPSGRIATDSRKVIYYYRASPDRRRVIFGGRVTAGQADPVAAAPRLRDAMCGIFPELRDCGISHAWSGTVAYSFDELAHCGVHDGIRYALGYCGSGVSMASYLGMRSGRKILGRKDGGTAFDDLPHPTRPFYTGMPWFLPAAVAWYRWRDRMECAWARRTA